MKYAETDSRNRLTLPGGRANQMYLVDEQPDGTIILRPARVISETQAMFDRSPGLQKRLAATLDEPTVRLDELPPRVGRRRGTAAS